MNLSNISNFNITEWIIPSRSGFRIEDIYSSVCNQLNSYFVNMGITIVCVYIFFSWFNWWFFSKGYKLGMFSYDKSSGFGKFIGDLNNRDTRIFWDVWIKDRLAKLLVGYIVVVIYFNLQ